MAIDVPITAILGFALLGAIGYIIYKSKADSWHVTNLDVPVLMDRVKESETLLVALKEAGCWRCGAKEKDVKGNLYADSAIELTCKGCGTITTWKRGNKQWQATTKTTDYTVSLHDTINADKDKEKLAKGPQPPTSQVR
ncbi:Uncharacterised protein [uncultured archaeon]|nr:Uncharacterised protein [uncultured archaeon]